MGAPSLEPWSGVGISGSCAPGWDFESLLDLTRGGGCPSEGGRQAVECGRPQPPWRSVAASPPPRAMTAAPAIPRNRLARFARSGYTRLVLRMSVPALHASSSSQPRSNLFARRGSGRGASHHNVLGHLCDHTFSSPRTLPDPAAAVRGPRSVLGWVLFGLKG